MPSRSHASLVTMLLIAACVGAERPSTDAPVVVLGPADGRELGGVDLERVAVGSEAPDFTLTSLAGPAVTLSDFRGTKNVVLVFYRGHW